VKSAVETVEPTRVKLAVEVSYDELKPNLDAAYKQIAQQVTVPGFRKGKVPPRIIDQRIGRAAVVEQAVNDALPDLYRRAVTESGIRPLGQPSVEVTEIPDVAGTAGGQLAFTAEVDVRPEITLPDLSDITLTVPGTEVDEADVDARLQALRERFGSLVGVDRAAADGDFVVLDLRATIDDEEVDSVSGVSYQIGSGNMLEGLDEALIGLAAGESATFEAPLAGGEHAGEVAAITVTPTAVKQRDLPEADDDFAQLASEFDTVEELLEDLRAQAAVGKRADQAAQARDRLLDELLARVDFPLPTSVIDAEVEHHLEGEGRLEDEAHREEVRGEATEALRTQLLVDALAERLAVSVDQQELIEFLLRTSQQYNMDPQTFVSQADKAGQIPAFVAEVARSKAIALALREVSIVDESGEPVDLSAIIGSAEADEAAAAAFAEDASAAEDAGPEATRVEDAEVEGSEVEGAEVEDVQDAEVEDVQVEESGLEESGLEDAELQDDAASDESAPGDREAAETAR
jgi:trigger factor